MMTIMKWGAAAAVALSFGLPICRADDGDRTAWVEKRIQDWQPTAEERRLDEIGWAKDIRTAERLAKEHGRPIFLFTYDGVCLATYRC